MTEEESRRIAADSFPDGPEKLAKVLGVEVRYAELSGREGWCWYGGPRTIVRVNTAAKPSRRRFTLAHELAHIVQGTAADIVNSAPFRSTKTEEREADRLAAELLLPLERLEASLDPTSTVDFKTLQRIAKAAKVSPITVACRVVKWTEQSQLNNSAVVFFENNDLYRWTLSSGPNLSEANAQALFHKLHDTNSSDALSRFQREDGSMIAASVLNAWEYKAMFVQVLPGESGHALSPEERLQLLRQRLFGSGSTFESRLAGWVNYIQQNSTGLTVSEAVQAFNDRYLDREHIAEDVRAKLANDDCQEFIRLKMSQKCLPDVGAPEW